MNAKVLITGGSGFFGTSLTKGLLEKEYSVRILDPEYPASADIRPRIEFIQGDIRNKEIVREASKGISIVFHNAAILPISRSHKKIFWEVNVEGTRTILETALINKVRKVIFISSSAPYGIPKDTPVTENTPFNPVCDYGRSKIAAEEICNEYRSKGLDVVILRPRTLVGKGRLGLFQILFNWIADNKRIYLIGKGNNPFSFLSERDFVKACIVSIEKDCKNGDFNLGTDKFNTVKEDLESLIRSVGSSSKIVPLPASATKLLLSVFDMFSVVPFTPWHYKTCDKPFYFDITKARKTLGWFPEVSNFEMLKDGYNDYISHRKDIDSDFGTIHTKSVRQRILRVLKSLS
ncbi:MAG: NAD(P)-dependent oxidoreductase [Candidatus Omnitrophota bacterium]